MYLIVSKQHNIENFNNKNYIILPEEKHEF